MRSGPWALGMSVIAGCGGRSHPHEDGRSPAGLRFDLQRRADERRAFLHPQQSESLTIHAGLACIEADAVVFDDQEDLIAPPFEYDIDLAGSRVLGRVGQRFPEQSCSSVVSVSDGSRSPSSPELWNSTATSGAPRPVLHIVRQGGAESEIVEGCRPQFPDELVHVAIQPLSDLLERFDGFAQRRVSGRRRFQRADSQSQGGELLAELIVHLSGDAAPFVFLGEDEPCVQKSRRARSVRLTLDHFGEQRGVDARAAPRFDREPCASSSSCARRSISSARFRSERSKWVPTMRTTVPSGCRRTG